MAKLTPKDATSGAKTKDVLSPTPPVECLSTLTPGISDKSSLSPELSIEIAILVASSSSIPFK